MNIYSSVKYIKICLQTFASISLAGMVACSEERPATEQDLIVGKAWLTCTQQEKWEKAYRDVGTIGTKLAIREECGAEPPYLPDD